MSLYADTCLRAGWWVQEGDAEAADHAAAPAAAPQQPGPLRRLFPAGRPARRPVLRSPAHAPSTCEGAAEAVRRGRGPPHRWWWGVEKNPRLPRKAAAREDAPMLSASRENHSFQLLSAGVCVPALRSGLLQSGSCGRWRVTAVSARRRWQVSSSVPPRSQACAAVPGRAAPLLAKHGLSGARPNPWMTASKSAVPWWPLPEDLVDPGHLHRRTPSAAL